MRSDERPEDGDREHDRGAGEADARDLERANATRGTRRRLSCGAATLTRRPSFGTSSTTTRSATIVIKM